MKRKGKSVKGGREREDMHLYDKGDGSLQSFEDICSEVSRYAANFIINYLLLKRKIFFFVKHRLHRTVYGEVDQQGPYDPS